MNHYEKSHWRNPKVNIKNSNNKCNRFLNCYLVEYHLLHQSLNGLLMNCATTSISKPLHFLYYKSSLTLHTHLVLGFPSGRFLLIIPIRTFFNTSPPVIHTYLSHSRSSDYNIYVIILIFHKVMSAIYSKKRVKNIL